ncbi:Protein of unknown function [Cotesia congregata]|uniref:Uncharacterized protein n=1 Tax=Cotesia congregata TaxID=51543 RepID=A0A8J2HBE1_COTCN|nr:Protein of unknown function [Cotesia congregata]
MKAATGRRRGRRVPRGDISQLANVSENKAGIIPAPELGQGSPPNAWISFIFNSSPTIMRVKCRVLDYIASQ